MKGESSSSSASTAPEFVAVVLACTVGTRLFPMTSTSTTQENSISSKHMLPVAGIPVLYRLLAALEASGFCETVVAVQEDETAAALLRDAQKDNKQDSSSSIPQHPYKPVNQNKNISTKDDDDDGKSATNIQYPLILQSEKMKVTLLNLATTDNQNKQEEEDCPGSVEALRRIIQQANLISKYSHVCVVPGDLVVLNVETSLKKLVDTHRKGVSHHNRNNNKWGSTSSNSYSAAPAAACTVLLTDVGEVDEQHGMLPLKESAKQKKGLLAREAEEIDYIAIASSSTTTTNNNNNTSSAAGGRLIWKQPKLDVEQDKDMVGATPKLVLPKARLNATATSSTSSSITRVSTEWNDVHCYCLSPWVVQRLISERRPSLVSMQTDLVPLLIARQFRGVAATFGRSVEKEVVQEVLQTHFFDNNGKKSGVNGGDSLPTSAGSSSHSNPASPLVSTSTSNTATTTAVRSTRAAPVHEDSAGAGDALPVIEYSVLAHVAETKAAVVRSHSIAAYLYANREVAHQVSAIAAVHTTAAPAAKKTNAANPCLALPPGTSVKPKFQSILLADTVTGDKVTFKSSVVGKNCQLGSKCRLNNVVLQDNVTVGDNTILQNTIVGKNCTIAENCNLNDCQICPGKSIPAGTKKKGEAFIDDDDM